MRILDQHRHNLVDFLRSVNLPLGLLRAVQLLGIFVLESSSDVTDWIQLITQVELATDLAPKWRQALLSSPLISTNAKEFLDKAELFLIANDGIRLNDLLVALRTVQVNPDSSLLPLTESIEQTSDAILSLLLTYPIPRWNVWLPMMAWLLENANKFPASIRLEMVRLMEIWQRKAPNGAIYRKEIGELALRWLKETER